MSTRIPEEVIENIQKSNDIVDVIEEYVQLKKQGRNYFGLCPFHDEKTPSFIIQKGKKHYHCFGCGAHGDAIGFLMNLQKLSFQEAVEHLADRFNIRLDYAEYSDDGERIKRKEIHEALFTAYRFFQFILFTNIICLVSMKNTLF